MSLPDSKGAQLAAAQDPALSWRGRVRAAANPAGSGPWLDERANVLGLGLAIVTLIVFFTVKSPYFLTVSNFEVIGTAVSVAGVMSAVSTIVLVSGGLDLSIGAVAALGGLVAAEAISSGWSLGWALAAGFGAGALAGLANTALVVVIGVNALIATIGTQFMVRGIDYLIVNGQPVDVNQSKHFIYVGNGTPWGVPMPIFIMAGCFIVAGAVLRFTRFGSRVYATGGSPSAATLGRHRVGRLGQSSMLRAECPRLLRGSSWRRLIRLRSPTLARASSFRFSQQSFSAGRRLRRSGWCSWDLSRCRHAGDPR